MTAADRWREQLAAWAIPDEIVANGAGVAVGVRDGVLPATRRGGSRSRADADDPPRPRGAPRGRHRARRRRRRRRDVAPAGGPRRVDRGDRQQADMLEGFLAERRGGGGRGARGDRGMAGRVRGRRAGGRRRRRTRLLQHPRARTVRARAGRARPPPRGRSSSRERHPLEWMRDLWLHFHDLERPDGPTAEDARGVLAELGLAGGSRGTVGDGGRTAAAGSRAARTRSTPCASGCACPPTATPRSREALGDRLRRARRPLGRRARRSGRSSRCGGTGSESSARDACEGRTASTRSTVPRPCSSTRPTIDALVTAPSASPATCRNGRTAPNPPKSRPFVGSIDVCARRSAMPLRPASCPTTASPNRRDLRLRDREVALSLPTSRAARSRDLTPAIQP